ncbi:Uncharacterized protein AArcCO_1968 [Halalkaliarchaeum sp. AArc-CO]|uniref:hypothetical protein n=1 Tax=unclassified Halalkaliarchaeum TaxID=2678344 RepID=UPI00217D7C8E|nr:MULTISPECIES: hypothetical protein [unclassified Halalkaliarchaeum]MDR5671768.1 hypothetical protein [Halalkaliarchaeum sp. AArc-GB]UWG51265.1 Uncharacterized protein AArcCO_1968 [Halalkaliarchaeum sp. AArc-CO]
MRFKPVPTVPERSSLEDVRRAIPLVPASEPDCKRRLRERLDIDETEAGAWLAFLRALGLVERTARGYRRTRREETSETLDRPFRRRVYAAEEALTVVSSADRPLTAAEIAERITHCEPTWERHRRVHHDEYWRERTGLLLEWAVRLDLADRIEPGEKSAVPTYRLKTRR